MLRSTPAARQPASLGRACRAEPGTPARTGKPPLHPTSAYVAYSPRASETSTDHIHTGASVSATTPDTEGSGM